MKATQGLNDADCRMTRERSRRIRITGLAGRLLAAPIGLLFAGVPVAAADRVLDDVHVAAGRVFYEKYCMPCHGSGGRPGSAVYRVGDKPVDLRRYVARKSGQFPADEWIAVIEHNDLTSPHSEVWEQIRSSQAGTSSQEAAARGIVVLIADYIISVQTK
jgi:hypothetical protein